MNKPIGENSSLNISLPMLIQAVGFIAAMVWGYGQLNTRISFVEHQANSNEQTIKEMNEIVPGIIAFAILVIGVYIMWSAGNE